MTKYTLNKVFERNFPNPIWKIEADSTHSQLAIESRNLDTTLPSFTVIDFAGNILLEDYKVDDKAWTLEEIQGDYLILKRFGEYAPIQSGIQVINIQTRQSLFIHMEYVIKNVYKNYLEVFHRNIPSGLLFYINLETGNVEKKQDIYLEYADREIHYPIPFSGNIPSFLQDLTIIDQIWLQPFQEHFLWSFHTKNGDKFNLNLSLSNKYELCDSKLILEGLDKLIPQPYFIVKEHIFFLSSNKMKISSYLV